jgi:multicomponent Na+:H+ antiporter subunit F
MIAISIIAVLVSLLLLLARLLLGPTIFDRLLVMNSFGTCVTLLIILIGEAQETAFYIDIALIYALINFVTTIAFLRYFESRLPDHSLTSGEKA